MKELFVPILQPLDSNDKKALIGDINLIQDYFLTQS